MSDFDGVGRAAGLDHDVELRALGRHVQRQPVVHHVDDIAAQTADDAAFAATPFTPIRLHGDCHPGNILWRDEDPAGHGPHIVDLDDAVTGPAVQDLWMLLSGDRSQRARRKYATESVV